MMEFRSWDPISERKNWALDEMGLMPVAGAEASPVPQGRAFQLDRNFGQVDCESEEDYPRTDTPENESTARPRTGWPKTRAGSKRLNNSIFSTCARVAASSGPETMR